MAPFFILDCFCKAKYHPEKIKCFDWVLDCYLKIIFDPFIYIWFDLLWLTKLENLIVIAYAFQHHKEGEKTLILWGPYVSTFQITTVLDFSFKKMFLFMKILKLILPLIFGYESQLNKAWALSTIILNPLILGIRRSLCHRRIQEFFLLVLKNIQSHWIHGNVLRKADILSAIKWIIENSFYISVLHQFLILINSSDPTEVGLQPPQPLPGVCLWLLDF